MTGDSSRILVIADDLTGAAEIAGIAADFALPARIIRISERQSTKTLAHAAVTGTLAEGVTVLDTDSRILAPDDAAQRIAQSLEGLAVPHWSFIYQKTDSILRGNVATELPALQKLLARPRALLLPQNPSKGRTVDAGTYRINGTPLHETPFHLDPEHPRRSSSIQDLLAPTVITVANPDTSLPPTGIIALNATSLDHVQQAATLVDAHTFPAGGADFFKALLIRHFGHAAEDRPHPTPHPLPRLILAGSASGYSRDTIRQWEAKHLPIFALPTEVRPTSNAFSAWQSDVFAALLTRRLAIVAITSDLQPDRARLFRQSFAQVLQILLASQEIAHRPLHLFIEGGATAAAAVDALHWSDFRVVDSLFPGVVTLRPQAAQHIVLTMKPGSYPWPPGFP